MIPCLVLHSLLSPPDARVHHARDS
jgi:hypothetical protein